MTLQRSLQSGSRFPVADLREARRRERREQLGLCICGAPIAWHFDSDNRHLSCSHPDVVIARFRFRHHLPLRASVERPISATSHGSWSDDDAKLALLIYSKRGY